MLSWVGKNKMVCQEPECVKNFKFIIGDNEAVLQKVETMSRQEYRGIPDWDFFPFHCREKNCHDVSLGKTSAPCVHCGLWVCQSHAAVKRDQTFHEACILKQHQLKRKLKSTTCTEYMCKRCPLRFTNYHPIMKPTSVAELNREIDQDCKR